MSNDWDRVLVVGVDFGNLFEPRPGSACRKTAELGSAV